MASWVKELPCFQEYTNLIKKLTRHEGIKFIKKMQKNINFISLNICIIKILTAVVNICVAYLKLNSYLCPGQKNYHGLSGNISGHITC